jgi:hypothetical protein
MRRTVAAGAATFLLLALVAAFAITTPASPGPSRRPFGLRLAGPSGSAGSDQVISSNAAAMIEEGRQTFRFDTFPSPPPPCSS